MNSKEALEKLGNVEVAVTTIRSDITHFKTLKEQYAKEFEVLEKELLFVRDIKPFDVYEEEYKKLEKENQELRKRLDSIPPEFDGYLYFAKSISNIINENTKLKKALDILKILVGVNSIVIFPKERVVDITQEEYELLKSVLGEE